MGRVSEKTKFKSVITGGESLDTGRDFGHSVTSHSRKDNFLERFRLIKGNREYFNLLLNPVDL